MKRLIAVLVVLTMTVTMALAGCGRIQAPSGLEGASSGKGEETIETVLPKEPPADVTWISPGKVHVGNFYPGARAEWILLVHNGKQKLTSEGQPTGIFLEAQFTVGFRKPDHVGEGYSKPAKEVQSWVIIADTTPVLAPKETREILVILEMPENADGWAVPVWNLSELGITTRDELKIAYQIVVEKAMKEGKKELPGKPELLLFLEGIYGVIVGSVEVNEEYMDYVLPTNESKWEFWVSVKDTTQTGMVRTELCSRWLISHRE